MAAGREGVAVEIKPDYFFFISVAIWQLTVVNEFEGEERVMKCLIVCFYHFKRVLLKCLICTFVQWFNFSYVSSCSYFINCLLIRERHCTYYNNMLLSN